MDMEASPHCRVQGALCVAPRASRAQEVWGGYSPGIAGTLSRETAALWFGLVVVVGDVASSLGGDLGE